MLATIECLHTFITYLYRFITFIVAISQSNVFDWHNIHVHNIYLPKMYTNKIANKKEKTFENAFGQKISPLQQGVDTMFICIMFHRYKWVQNVITTGLFMKCTCFLFSNHYLSIHYVTLFSTPFKPSASRFLALTKQRQSSVSKVDKGDNKISSFKRRLKLKRVK